MENNLGPQGEEIDTVTSFDLVGPVGEKLIRPSCVSISKTGEYVVSDTESCFIIIYSAFGEYLSHFSTIPKSIFYLLLDIDKHKPNDVAWLSSKKVVYTQPWGSKVVVSNWKGHASTCIEGKPLYQPYGVCVDDMDQIYVTDRDKGRILCYRADGKLVKSFGGFQSNGFSLTSPHYIVISKRGNIVINDVVKDYIDIKIFNKKTGTHKTISTNIEKGENIGCLTIDADDKILQANTKNNTIHSFSSNLNENSEYSSEKCNIDSINNMYGIAFNQKGSLVCIDQFDKRIKMFPWAKDNIHFNGHVESSSEESN